ncbi:hypothetical protein LguiA_003855 [Lonicera macranthoides]
MGSFSLNTFSLCSHSKIQNPQIKTHSTLKKSPLITAIHLHKSLSFNPILQCPTNFHSHLITNSTKSPSLQEPNSRNTNPFIPTKEISNSLEEPYSRNTNSFTPKKVISNFFKKIVIVLVGSFIFFGFVNTRPVLAQKVSYSENLEEKEVTHESEIEDEEMYVRLLKGNRRNVEALKMVLNLKMRRGDTRGAVEYVERLIQIEPDEVEWRLLEALCYEMMGQFSKARRLFKEILKERPLLLRALHGLAMVMHKNLEGPAVFEMLNKALDIARREKRVIEERNIRILIAQMHVVKGELEEGLELFQELVNENPKDFRPYLCQGIIYSLLDKKEEAENQFETYRSLVPEEFPQRGFLDDVVLAAKTESRQQL